MPTRAMGLPGAVIAPAIGGSPSKFAYYAAMAEYQKDTRFSWGWMFGGILLMFITNFVGGFAAGAAGVSNLWAVLGIACGAFALGGFIIGWQSEGRTIIEAGLSAILAIAISLALKGSLLAVLLLNPLAFVIAVAIPFAFAMLGAWIGEIVQGDVITTKDD